VYGGNTLISGGTLVLANSLALQYSSLNISGSGTLSFGGLTAASFGGLQGPGNIALTNANAAAVALTVGGNGAATTYSGNLSGAGGSLVKTGAGALLLAGSNTFTGGTTITAGVLQVKTPIALPGGTLSGCAVAGGATVSFNVGGQGEFTESAVNAALAKRRDDRRRRSLGFDTNDASAAFTYSSNIGASFGSLSKFGSGVLVLANTQNSYPGSSNFNGGEIGLSSLGSLGTHPC